MAFIFSFEAIFALFLYSNNLKLLLPPLPIDETLVVFLLVLPTATILVWRTGIPTRAVPLVVAGLLFFGWLAITLLWSPGRKLAVHHLTYNLAFNMSCLLLSASIIAPDPARRIRFFWWVILIALILTCHGLSIYVRYGTLRYYLGLLDTRAYLAWTHPVASASAITLVWGLTASLGRSRQIVGLVLSAIFGYFLLVAGARAPLLAFIFSMTLLPLMSMPWLSNGQLRVAKLQLAALAFVVLAGGYLAYRLSVGDLTDTLSRIASIAGYIQNVGTSDRHSRLAYWEGAIRLWATAPLMGIGIGGFSALYNRGFTEDPGSHPHNIVLEILVEAGLLGVILFVAVLMMAMRYMAKARLLQDCDYRVIVVWLLSVMCVRAMTSTDLAGQWELFVVLGLCSAASVQQENASRVRSKMGA